MLFDSPDVSSALSRIGGLFGAGGLPAVNAESLYCLRSYAVVLALALVGATPLPKLALARLRRSRACALCLDILEPLALTALLAVCTAYLIDGSFNPFLYFRF